MMLIFTGFRQNSLMGDYSAIVKESEGTIFFYSTIREQTTEGLLSRNPSQLLAAAEEIGKLQSRYTAMLENSLIPSQYKLSFLLNLDLEQLTLDLKNLAESPDNEELIRKIIAQLRLANNQFLQFDRIVVSEMKSRVMLHQKNGLVLMGLIICISTFSMITLYRKSVKPLITLSSQAELSLTNRTPLTLSDEKKASTEIKTLLSSFNQLLQNTHHDDSPDTLTNNRREAEISGIINEVTNRLNGIINYSQLLADYCESQNVGDEQKKILYKIIENGEKSAAILQKGLPGGEV
jgi:hypothetical protein